MSCLPSVATTHSPSYSPDRGTQLARRGRLLHHQHPYRRRTPRTVIDLTKDSSEPVEVIDLTLSTPPPTPRDSPSPSYHVRSPTPRPRPPTPPPPPAARPLLQVVTLIDHHGQVHTLETAMVAPDSRLEYRHGGVQLYPALPRGPQTPFSHPCAPNVVP
jgi:hypothetical protein